AMLPITALLMMATCSMITTSAFPERITDHFYQFLMNNPEKNEFALRSYRDYDQAGTFGGRVEDDDDVDEDDDGDTAEKKPEIRHDPVVFVHGNQESALWFNENAHGWNKQIKYFLKNGYSMQELHGLSHGARNVVQALSNRFTCDIFKGVRHHIEAVLHYTQSEKVDVISHSMGVTIARAAILGGTIHFTNETCHLGPSLAGKVDTFLGIAGAHYGVCYCSIFPVNETKACSNDAFATGTCRVGNESDKEMELHAGVRCTDPETKCDNEYSRVLRHLNERNERVADFTVSTWTLKDEILGHNNMAFGKKTSHMPLSDLTLVYGHLNHSEIKDLTARHQFQLVTVHDINVEVPNVSHHHHRNRRYNTTHRAAHRHIHVEHLTDEEDEY
ncbi:hypothetical protein PENTCL1PPCAC_4993, partial [Pristionchus entomophagus]